MTVYRGQIELFRRRGLAVLQLLLVVLIPISLSGLDPEECTACCPQRWWSGLEGGAELLYMQLTRCDLEYAVADPRPYTRINPISPTPQEDTEEFGPVGAIRTINPDYKVGFRIMAGIVDRCQCSDLRGIYTRLHAHDAIRLGPGDSSVADTFGAVPSGGVGNANGGIWASELIDSDPTRNPQPIFFQSILFNPSGNPALPFEVPAEAHARLEIDYDSFDLQVAVRGSAGCSLWWRTFAGLHFTWIDQLFSVIYQGTEHVNITPAESGNFQSRAVFGYVRRTGQAWGLGPIAGGEGIFQICQGFGITGRAMLGVIAGERKTKYFQKYLSIFSASGVIDQNRIYDIDAKYESLVAPVVGARLGFSYNGCCKEGGNMSLAVSIGWEWLSYINLVPVGPRFRMDKQVQNLDNATLSLSGLYLSGRLSF